MAYAVRGKSSSLLAPSVYRGPASRRAIALTFDDGPSEGTEEILEILHQHDARGTFFACGSNAERLPDVLRSVAGAGHEVGNHSYSHPAFYFRGGDFIASELRRTQEVIGSITGCTPALLRTPYGVRWFGLREAQQSLHLLGVMWTVIGLDWKLNAGCIVDRVLHGARNGAIICLHDGRGIAPRPDIRETVAATRQIVPALRSRGFQLETVSRLLCPTN